jgi:outer membrane biosynthesis protein TonB
MRSLLVPQALWKALLVSMLMVSALPVEAQAQTKAKTQTKAKSKSRSKAKAKTPTPEPEKAPEPQKAPEPEPQKPAETTQQKAQEPAKASEKAPEKAPAPAKAQTAPKAKAPGKAPPPKVAERPVPLSQLQAQERAEASSRLRIGVGLDLFTEKASMTGNQAINESNRDESFKYGSATFLSATLSMSVPAPIAKDRARIGGAVRLFGNYSAGGDRQFGFGLLNQAFITGEYGLPVKDDKTEVVFGGRLGLSLLVPGSDFDQEIDRLQVQGVGVWSLPRVGWLGGLSVGGRRRMSEHILLRADLSGQLEKLYLFATNEDIEGLQFKKDWSTLGLRLGLNLGIEFAL